MFKIRWSILQNDKNREIKAVIKHIYYSLKLKVICIFLQKEIKDQNRSSVFALFTKLRKFKSYNKEMNMICTSVRTTRQTSSDYVKKQYCVDYVAQHDRWTLI